MELYRRLKESLKGRISLNEPLSKHTAFRIGGPAKIWFEPCDIEDLRKAMLFIKNENIKFFVIGNGTNILADSKGFHGMVISLFAPAFQHIVFKDDTVRAGSGVTLTRLIIEACEKSLGGLESVIGIPGTVGGAVMMNSGYREAVSDFIKSVTVINKNGDIKTLAGNKLKFGYRSSNLSGYIILEAEFALKKAKKKTLLKECERLMRSKKRTQPLDKKSAGCIFKNPKIRKLTAAELIESCGLKGSRVGGAGISKKHANFIINAKNATSDDVLKLIGMARAHVKKRFKITLKPEIIKI